MFPILNPPPSSGEAFGWEEILGRRGSKRAERLTSVLLPHLLNIHLPSFFIAILASRAVVHSFGCILQSSGVFENHDAWSHLQKSDLTGLGCGWGMRAWTSLRWCWLAGSTDSRGCRQQFSECDLGTDGQQSSTREMCEECEVLGFTLDLLSEKPWNWIPAMCVLPSLQVI